MMSLESVVLNVQSMQRKKRRWSLITTGRTADWGGGILKIFLKSSPASLLESIYRKKQVFPTLHELFSLGKNKFLTFNLMVFFKTTYVEGHIKINRKTHKH